MTYKQIYDSSNTNNSSEATILPLVILVIILANFKLYMNSVRSGFTPSDFKDMGINKFESVWQTRFFYNISHGTRPQTSQTAHTLYLDRLSRPIVSRHVMLRFHVMFFD